MGFVWDTLYKSLQICMGAERRSARRGLGGLSKLTLIKTAVLTSCGARTLFLGSFMGYKQLIEPQIAQKGALKRYICIMHPK